MRLARFGRHVFSTDEKLFKKTRERNELRDLGFADRASESFEAIARLPVLEIASVHLFSLQAGFRGMSPAAFDDFEWSNTLSVCC